MAISQNIGIDVKRVSRYPEAGFISAELRIASAGYVVFLS
jgi:hypothetical protein